MADTVALPVSDGFGGFGGAGLGAGFIGGLVLGSIWNGNGFGGWGNNRGAMPVGSAVADTMLSNQLQHVSDQVTQGNISQLQSAQGLTNSINGAQMSLNNAVNQNTISQLQSTSGLSQQLCCSTMNLGQQIDQNGDQTVAAINQSVVEGMRNAQSTNDRLCAINNNITSQGYENRLQNQELAAQLQRQHGELSRQIFEENCRDRELQREIQAQNVRDQLAQAQAQNAALTAQINLTNQLTAQTAYLVQQLGTTTTTRTATTGA